MQKTYFYLFILFFFLPTFCSAGTNSTLTEGFNDSGWGTSYGDYTLNGWSLKNVFRETTATYEGASAVRLGKSGNTKAIISPEKTGGIGTISLWHRRWSASDGNITYSIYKSVDGVNRGTALISFESTSDSYSQYTFDINDASAKYVKIESESSYERAIIDLVSITDYSGGSMPGITVSETTLNFNNVYAGNSSAPLIYTVSGSDLTADIEISAPSGYEISTLCSTGYGSSLTLSQNSGLVAETKIYVRFSPSATATYSGNITHTSTGVTTKNISVNETNTISNMPADYYSTATGSGRTLLTQLYNKIKGHTARTYTQLWTDFQTTDVKPNGKVWDMYSDMVCDSDPYEFTFVSNQCGTFSNEGDCYNREHSFPKSWWGGSETADQYTDLFHLVPTDGKVNGQRSNWEFGIVSSPTWTSQNGSKLGANTYSGSSGATAFEPTDDYKGDLARGYFYLATRYSDVIDSWTISPMIDGDINDSDGSVFEEWALNMLIEWHTNDPVSQKELNRNDAIYTIQNNRNPFIDHPEWVSSIWANTDPAISVIPTTLSNFTYDEGSGPSTSQSFTLSGENLEGTNVNITAPTNYEISTDDSNFGASLNINYTAPTLGNTTIYVRLKSGLSVGDYNNETISCTDNGTTTPSATLTASGSVSAVLVSGCADELIISEYVEGSSSNKYIELSNYTGSSVDLSNYELRLYSNGSSSPSNTNTLSGTLADGASIVFSNSSADAYTGTTTDVSAVNFNGNDAFALYNSNTSEFVDIIGCIGEDPGSAWTSGSHSTVEKTLVRKTSVLSGVTTNPTSGFPTLESEWDAYSQNEVGYLGTHTMNCTSYSIGWCNLQTPESMSVNERSEALAYGRIYVEGLTETTGNEAEIKAWIGYSTNNSDPATWTNWIEATYNTKHNNNYEYMADIGSSLNKGTYYFATRFQLAGSLSYSYGGYNATGGNFWDGTTNLSGILTVVAEKADWCNLQWPESGTIEKGMDYNVYAQVYEPGVTEPTGQGSGFEAWIGYSTENTNPNTWTNWIVASYNTDLGSNDEYMANISPALAEGTYYYASRFRLNGSTEYTYGGYNSGGGGFWDGSSNVNGVLSIEATDVTAGTTIPGTAISSLADTQGEAVNVLKFKVTDPGEDGKVTQINNISIKPHTTNTADWTNTIQGIVLNNNTVTIESVTITDTEIDIAITSGNYEIADNNTPNEITLGIYLNTSNIVDGEVLSFMIDADNHGFTADAGNSKFVATFSGGDIISNDFTLDISASEIRFTNNKPSSGATVNVDFSVEVEAVDANGNRDLNATNSVTLSKASGSGNLSSTSGLTQNLVNGAFEWTNAQLDAEDTYTITATTSGLTTNSVTSGNIVAILCSPAADGSGAATISNSLTGNMNGTDVWQRNLSSQEVEITISGESSNCLTTLEIDLTELFDALDVANVSLSGDAVQGNTVIAENTDNILTVSNVILTDAETLTISATALNTVDVTDINDFGNKSIDIKSTTSGTLTSLSGLPSLYLTIPFANAKKLSGSTLVNKGETVAIEAISTIASGRLRSNTAYDQFFLQEGNGASAKGICIYKSGEFSPVREIAHNYVVKGQLGLVSGTDNTETDAYANMTAIINPDLIIDLGAATLPTPYVVEIDDGAANGLYTMSDADFEEVDGLLMRIKNIKKESGTWPTDNLELANIQLYDNDINKDLRCFIFANTNIGGNPEPDWASDDVDMVTLVYNFDKSGSGVEDRQITPVYYDNFFKTIVWDNATGNGLWADAENWSPNVLPQIFDDVVFDNITGPSGNYDVTFNVTSAEINSLTISPNSENTITFTIPESNTNVPALTLNSPDDALKIQNGGVFINNSGALSGYPINFAGLSPILRIENGGKYVQKTSSANSNYIDILATDNGTETGIFEFDVARDVNYPVSISGRTYGNLMFSATTNSPVYTFLGSNDLTIRGNLTINTGVQISENSYTGNFVLGGNFTNNATNWTFNPGQNIQFNGTEVQTYSGTFTGNFDKSIIVDNASGLEINNLLYVKENAPDFTINSGAKASVMPNSGLTVEGNFVNSGEFYLKSPENSGAPGSLITEQSGSEISGTAFAERFIPRNEWHYVSSPVSNAESDMFTSGANGPNPNFFYYNEAENAETEPTSAAYSNWELISSAWQKAHNGEGTTPSALEIGRGYATYDNGYRTVVFEGLLNNGDINIPVTYTDNDNNGGTNSGYFDGWNLIGNPFPSPIDWNNANWDKTYIDNTLYFYEENQVTGEKIYRYYNGTGGSVTDVEGLSVNSESATPNIIPMGQGFFVKAKSSAGAGGQNVLVPNAARVHSQQVFWKNENKSGQNMLRLKAEANGKSDETVIRFVKDATPAHDSKYDAYKMKADGKTIPQIFSLAKNVPLAINTLAEIEPGLIVPLAFSCETSGNYTINATELRLPSEGTVYLLDKITSTKVNLRKNPQYSFSHESGITKRFEIHFGETSDLEIENYSSFEVSLFSRESEIYINVKSKNTRNAVVKVYNLLGKNVFSSKIEGYGKHILKAGLSNGIYIVKFESVNYSKTEKVFIE